MPAMSEGREGAGTGEPWPEGWTEERITEAIYRALEGDEASDGYMDVFTLDAPVVIDGRFNLKAVARRLRADLGGVARQRRGKP